MSRVIFALLTCLAVAQANLLLGGWKNVATNSQDAMEMVDFAESSINARMNSMYLSKVTKVVSIHSQLVNGMNYRIEFEFSPTKCTKMPMTADLDACDANADITQVCKAKLYKSFAGVKEMNDFKCRQKSPMSKRAGQVQKVDDPSIYKDMALKATAMSNAGLKNIRVISATKQVVSGQRIVMNIAGELSDGSEILCKLDIWSRPWLPRNIGFIVNSFDCPMKSKRSILGGTSDVKNFKDFLPTAKKALSMTNSLLENLVVVKARVQTVAGRNYYLTVTGDEMGQAKICDIVIWSRLWVSGPEGFQVTHFQCKAQSKRALKLGGSCPGCVSDNVDDPERYMSLYIRAYGLAKTNMDINNIKILSVRTQVVAGTKYYMKVETSEAGEPRICDVTFVQQAWMTPDIIDPKFDCKAM